MSLVQFVVTVHDALKAATLPHAFGGALALNHIVDPRGTVDVDVNVFVDTDELDIVLAPLAELGLAAERTPADWMPSAGVRLRTDDPPFPVDVFPNLDSAYSEVEARTVLHPFGPEGRLLPFLSAEDLVLFKLSFGRAKDWVDIAAVANARPHLDAEYVERQLIALRGPAMHPRLARLRNLLE